MANHLIFPVVLWHSAPKHEATSLCLSQNNKHAVSGGKGGEVILWNVNPEKEGKNGCLTPKQVLSGHDTEIVAIATGIRIDLTEPLTAFITASSEGTICSWDVEDGCCISTIPRLIPFRPRKASEIPGSSYFVIAGDSKDVLVLEALKLTVFATLSRKEDRRRSRRAEKEESFVVDIAVSTEDATHVEIAVAYEDGQLDIWELSLDDAQKVNQKVSKPKTMESNIQSVAIAQDSTQVGLFSRRSFCLLDRSTFEVEEVHADSFLNDQEEIIGGAFNGFGHLTLWTSDRRIVRYSLEENEGATEFFELPIPEKGEAAAAPSDSPFVIYSRNGVIIATAFGSEVSIFQWGGEADNERGYSLFGDGDVGSHWNDALKEGRFSDEARVTASAAFMVERPLWVLGHEDGAIELHSIPQGTRLCRVHADESAVSALTVVRKNIWDYSNKSDINSLSWVTCLVLAGFANGAVKVFKLEQVGEFGDQITLNTSFTLSHVQTLYPHSDQVQKFMPLQVFDGSGMVPIEVDAEPILVSIGIDKSLTTFRRGASVCTTNINEASQESEEVLKINHVFGGLSAAPVALSLDRLRGYMYIMCEDRALYVFERLKGLLERRIDDGTILRHLGAPQQDWTGGFYLSSSTPQTSSSSDTPVWLLVSEAENSVPSLKANGSRAGTGVKIWTKRIGSDPATQVLLLDVHYIVKRLCVGRASEEEALTLASLDRPPVRKRSASRVSEKGGSSRISDKAGASSSSSSVNPLDIARIALAEFCVFRRSHSAARSMMMDARRSSFRLLPSGSSLSLLPPSTQQTSNETDNVETSAAIEEKKQKNKIWSELAAYADEMGIPIPMKASTCGVIGERSAMTFSFPREKAMEKNNVSSVFHGDCFTISPRLSAINMVAALSLAQALSPLLVSRAAHEIEMHFQSIGDKGIASILDPAYYKPPSMLQLACLYGKEASDCIVMGDAARAVLSITAQQTTTARKEYLAQRWASRIPQKKAASLETLTAAPEGTAALGLAMLVVEAEDCVSDEAKERVALALRSIIQNSAEHGMGEPRRYIEAALAAVLLSRSFPAYGPFLKGYDVLCQTLFRLSLRVNSLYRSSDSLPSHSPSSSVRDSFGSSSVRGLTGSETRGAASISGMTHHQMQLVLEQLRSSLTSIGAESPAKFVRVIGNEMGRGDVASAEAVGTASTASHHHPFPSSPSAIAAANAGMGAMSSPSRKVSKTIALQANVEASTVNLTALNTLMSVVKRHPFVVRPYLPGLVEAILRMLDPHNISMRERCLHACTLALKDLVEKFACIDFHRDSQRLAVGTRTGAIILYDMKVAARWRSFEGHQGQVVAVKFSGTGDSLFSVCVHDGTLRGWKSHSMGLFKSLTIGSSRCFMNQAIPKDVLKKLSDLEATLVPKKGERTTIITRATAGVHLLVSDDGRSVAIRAGTETVYEKATK